MAFEEFRSIHNDSDLFEYLKDKLSADRNNYLFIDEVQDIEGFEHVLRRQKRVATYSSPEAMRRCFLETLAIYAADNVGNLFSANNISKYLKSQRVDMSTTQVISYLKALSNAYLINKTGRMDVNGLKKFEVGDKYFFEDLGLRNCQLGFNLQRDIHKLLENAVYLHLRLLQYESYVGQFEQQEIDFVGVKQGKRVYIQVTYLITDQKTKEREFGNLMNIPDNYPKYVVSLDEFNQGSDVAGIVHLHDFLKLTEL